MKPFQDICSGIRLAATVCASLLATNLSLHAQGAAGDLDPSFSGDGKVLTDFFDYADVATNVALQTDGKIVAAGIARTGTDEATIDFAVARYKADGTLDSSFGTGGKVTTDFEGNADIASGIALQDDGKIVVAGRSQNATGVDFALVRYNANGTLDTSFGPDGNGRVRTIFPGGVSRILDIAIQDDQKIVAAGRVASPNVYDFALARYNTDGTLDSSFGFGGTVTTSFAPFGASAYALLIQPDQKIVAAGNASEFALARYNPDGSLDSTFGPAASGIVITDFEGYGSIINDLALAADGEMVAAGLTFVNFIGIDAAFALARYDSDGNLVTGFGSAGKVITNFSSAGDAVGSMVIDADGRIIASGYATFGGEVDSALARYLPDGSLDANFGLHGLVTNNLGNYDTISSTILQPDGKLVAVGGAGSNGDFAVTRYLTAGSAATAQALNIATRAVVGLGDNVLIAGFIINGVGPKQVILRGIGPSLPLDGKLADPTLDLNHDGTLMATNDNWKDTQQDEIEATTIPPTDDLESAIVATLDPGAYTAVLRGNGSTTGIGLIEVYDLAQDGTSELANISTRSFVDTGDNVLIGGLIIGGASDTAPSVIVRAIGPSLTNSGVTDALPDPTLELHDASGVIVAMNDDWKDTQQAEIEATTIPPTDDREAAIVAPLAPGNYTAIVRGKNGTTGVALVETYNLH